jgi:hypothetical protein
MNKSASLTPVQGPSTVAQKLIIKYNSYHKTKFLACKDGQSVDKHKHCNHVMLASKL